ncbi:hypothetical protein KSP39_PZI020365 [Platanthera zijinensis]|uniref:Uncharacterized protein n=1 Tax=Platanthera zijinensis TaxID=2320716 RepID=A0AAP0B025_9ASPA
MNHTRGSRGASLPNRDVLGVARRNLELVTGLIWWGIRPPTMPNRGRPTRSTEGLELEVRPCGSGGVAGVSPEEEELGRCRAGGRAADRCRVDGVHRGLGPADSS